MIPADWSRGLLTGGVAGVALAAALPTGGAGAWGQLATRVAAFTLLALAALVMTSRPSPRRLALPLGALAALAALGLVQSATWPAGLVAMLSPRHARLDAAASELLGLEAVDASLSLAPGLSRGAAFAFLAAGSVFFAAFVAGSARRHRRWIPVALVAGALAQLVLGARGWLAGTTPRLHGTFVNPNHLAYTLEIAMAVAFAWAVWGVHAQRREFALDRRLALVAPPVAAWLLLAAGLSLTGSRAGLAAAAAGLLAQAFLLPRALRSIRRGVVVKALAAAALAALGLLVWRGVGRLGETTLYEVAWGDRAIVWRESIALWRSFPLTGSGLGTFGEAFPLAQPAELTELYWRRAHNDPIELLVTGGVIGALLGLTLVIGVLRPLARVLRDGNRTEDRATALAAVGAVTSVGVHELMDFGLTLPGVALPLAALIGAACAARLRTDSPAAALVPDAAEGG